MSAVAEARKAAIEGEFMGPDPAGAVGRYLSLIVAYGVVVAASVSTLNGGPFDRVLIRVGLSFVAGLVLFGVVIGAHEAVHGTLFRSKLLSAIVGTISMATVVLPYGMYKRMHIEHHAWVNTDRDPEGNYQYGSLIGFVLLSAFFGAGFLFVVWWNALLSIAGRCQFTKTAGQRREISLSTAGCVVVAGALISLTIIWPIMLWLWVVPMLTTTFFWSSLILTPEHYGLYDTDAPSKTRSTRSNPVMRFVTWNLGFHTAHHLVPKVAGRRLPAFQESLSEEFWPEQTSGYLAMQRRIILSLLPGHRDFVDDRLVDSPVASEVDIDLTDRSPAPSDRGSESDVSEKTR